MCEPGASTLTPPSLRDLPAQPQLLEMCLLSSQEWDNGEGAGPGDNGGGAGQDLHPHPSWGAGVGRAVVGCPKVTSAPAPCLPLLPQLAQHLALSSAREEPSPVFGWGESQALTTELPRNSFIKNKLKGLPWQSSG